jgi:hypothetical protein
MALVWALVWLAAAGCGGGMGAAPTMALLPWEGHAKTLFDNGIDPAAVGLSLDGTTPEEHPLIIARTSDSEIVALMKIQTLTEDTFGPRTSYTLIMQVEGQPLIPSRTPLRRFELRILRGMPAFGIVERLGSELRGRKFIGFLRRFGGAEEPEWHWHLTAGTAAVAAVVRGAAAIHGAKESKSK